MFKLFLTNVFRGYELGIFARNGFKATETLLTIVYLLTLPVPIPDKEKKLS